MFGGFAKLREMPKKTGYSSPHTTQPPPPANFLLKGPFKCYVMQMGVGGVSDFPKKSVTKV